MTINTKQQEMLQLIKNIAHTRSIIYTEYCKILDQSKTEAKKLINEVFTLSVDLSELSSGVSARATNPIIILQISFTVDSFNEFLKYCIFGYQWIIREISEIEELIQADIAADKLEMKFMLLADVMYDFAKRNEDDIQIFKTSYYSEEIKPLFNQFFAKAPSNETLKNFFSESASFLDIGANYFTQMYDLMSEAGMLTPEFAKLKSTPNIKPAHILNSTYVKLGNKLQSYAALLKQYAVNIFEGENNCFVTEQDISEIANLLSIHQQIEDHDTLLCKEHNVLANLTATYAPSAENGILVAHPELTSAQVFNINYKSLVLNRKFNDLLQKIECEMQRSKSIFQAIIIRLQNASKLNEAAAPSQGNEESDPQTTIENNSELLKQQIAKNNLEAKQVKEAEKAKAAAIHQEKLVWAQQKKLAALNVAGAESVPVELHELSREDYATLTALFSKDRSTINFKIEQLMSLAEHCGAECSETKSGFKVKFSKSLAFISEPTAVKVSKSASSAQTAPTDDPMLTFHRQHRTDRNVDAGIVAAFKAALEEAGFTPKTCTPKPTNSPRMTGL